MKIGDKVLHKDSATGWGIIKGFLKVDKTIAIVEWHPMRGMMPIRIDQLREHTDNE